MKTNKFLRICIIVLLVVINVGCDQVSKSIVRKNIDAYEHIELIDDNLILTKVENTGAFLSAGGTLPEPIRNVLLSLVPALVLVGALSYAFFNQSLKTSALIGLCFIIGGGIGNVFDRIKYGSVTDFLHIQLGWFETGIFNMADVSIMIGFGLLLLQYFRKSEIPQEN
ncbi:signal peptidase II [Cytophagaceae bacterium DM2B3-1]|uniref:Lipoprotein signal peptidase n=1 Tax=Xanthocytophaga flava TaxID=3048013 RepID=A0ABT7CGK8_9BACT|nr:signal peptidase II [Xanthocytophaga flavus]MDJ1492850.1 signal peptidase II [Xanthocytophaga flavus]